MGSLLNYVIRASHKNNVKCKSLALARWPPRGGDSSALGSVGGAQASPKPCPVAQLSIPQWALLLPPRCWRQGDPTPRGPNGHPHGGTGGQPAAHSQSPSSHWVSLTLRRRSMALHAHLWEHSLYELGISAEG